MKYSILKPITLFTFVFLLLSLLSSCFAPHQHKFGEWTADKEANCMDGFTENRSCNCGTVETRTVPPKEHNFIDSICYDCGKGPSKGLEFYSNGDGTCSFIGRGTCTDAYIIFPTKSPSGDTVTEIPDGRFFGDEVLTSVYIPESVTEISMGAFSIAPNLSSINISPNNTVYASVDGVLYSKDLSTLIEYPEAKADTTFDIPTSVTTIGLGAFSGASNLVSINIPVSVQTIEMSAFRDCLALTSITIPEGVTTISDCTFEGCRSLSVINLPESITTIKPSAFDRCLSLTSFTVPSGVTLIPKSAFSECKALTEIKLHDKITRIGANAFSSCISLKQINIPDSVTRIDEGAFKKCTSLEEVIIPDGVTKIDKRTFMDCSTLVSVTIPESVTDIEADAFRYCKALSSIIFKGTVKQWETVYVGPGWQHGVSAKGVTCSDGIGDFYPAYY